MTFDAFQASLSGAAPPPELSPLLEALWHERHGNWSRAHEIAQSVEDDDGAWVHAYLHRREGDIGNAGYWYRRAGRRTQSGSLDDEWQEIVRELLERS